MNLLLNFPWIAKGLIFLGIFVLGGLAFAPVWIAAYKTFNKKQLPDAVKSRMASRRMMKHNAKVMQLMENKMIRTRNLIREVGYQLDEIMRSE